MELNVKERDRISVLEAGERRIADGGGRSGAAGSDALAFPADAPEVRGGGRRGRGSRPARSAVEALAGWPTFGSGLWRSRRIRCTGTSGRRCLPSIWSGVST